MAIGIRAGELNRRVTLQARKADIDTMGGQSIEWYTVAVLWASIVPTAGREVSAAQAVQSETTHTITVRYQPMFDDPKAVCAMRLLYKGRVLNITGCENQEERNHVVVLQAAEGLNQG